MWSPVVRELAGEDYQKAIAITRWPLREALMAYLHCLKRAAAENYRMELLAWASMAPHSAKPMAPPDVPDLLKN
jgi:hypothetical protein